MSEKRFKIMLAVDGSLHSQVAVQLVAGITWPPRTIIHVLAVAPDRWSFQDLSPEAQSVVAETLAQVRQLEWAAAVRLTRQTAEQLEEGGLTVEREIQEGHPSEMILQRAAELPADLIVIGAKGLCAPGEFRLGSTAHKLAHYADCSVLVVRPPERAQPFSVLLAADGSREAQQAADLLCALSLPAWAEVMVVSVAEAQAGLANGERRVVAEMPEAVRRALLDAAEARAGEVVERLCDCGAHVQNAIRFGHPAKEILSAAQEHDADLIVVGARGQTRQELYRLGGVAQKVVKYAECSVLVVR